MWKRSNENPRFTYFQDDHLQMIKICEDFAQLGPISAKTLEYKI
jgi:hypothetical protein